MSQTKNKNLKLAIQKKGRLTDETLSFLYASGLRFESYKKRLIAACRNFPLEILFVRDDDIPDYVATGTADLGILGQNLLNEERPKVKKLLNLRYGFCTLAVAVPKESSISTPKGLRNKTIATTYPRSAKKYFDSLNIPVTIMPLTGSVEIAPSLGIADAIVDLVSTGSTLILNDLRVLEKIYESESVLIANPDSVMNRKKILVDRLMMRFKGVLSAQNYKYVMMNTPESIVPKLKKLVPGLKSPTIAPLAQKGWVSVQTVIREDVFWETIEILKNEGATGIIVLPIEKIIN